MASLSLGHYLMAWRPSGRAHTWFIDETAGLVVHWQSVMSEYEDDDEPGVDPLDLLTHKQRFVLELRRGLVDGIEYSQREIAQLMGVSRSMVNQHEQAALKKLSKYLRKPPAPEPIGREE